MIRRVLKGGSFYDTWILRTSYRFRDLPVRRYWFYGFRLVIRRAP